MHAYQGVNNVVIRIKPMTGATIRRAKREGLDWLTDLEKVTISLTDVEKLGEAIAFLSGVDVDTVLEGLAGDVIEKAQDVFFGVIADFYPSRIGQTLRQQLAEIRAEIDRAMKEISTEPSSSSEESSDSTLGATPSEILT